jgi:hypothetical protein
MVQRREEQNLGRRRRRDGNEIILFGGGESNPCLKMREMHARKLPACEPPPASQKMMFQNILSHSIISPGSEEGSDIQVKEMINVVVVD